jgi:hypothetical protein
MRCCSTLDAVCVCVCVCVSAVLANKVKQEPYMTRWHCSLLFPSCSITFTSFLLTNEKRCSFVFFSEKAREGHIQARIKLHVLLLSCGVRVHLHLTWTVSIYLSVYLHFRLYLIGAFNTRRRLDNPADKAVDDRSSMIYFSRALSLSLPPLWSINLLRHAIVIV